jgi:hypothetical protein
MQTTDRQGIFDGQLVEEVDRSSLQLSERAAAW